MLTLNLLNSNRLLGDSKRTIKGDFLAISFVRAIYAISFPNGLNKASNTASSILSIYFIRTFLYPAGVTGVAVTLL